MWILLALVTATCTAVRDVASKRATRVADPVLVSLGIAGVPALVLGAIVLAMGLPPIRPGFATALVVSGGINAIATPLIVLALRRSDLSLVAPVTSLTPLFMIATGALVLGELPGATGALGIAVIVAGAYMLTLSDRRHGLTGPLRALARDPGARLMLGVAFIYSVSASYDKVGTAASSPLVWAAAIHAAAFVLLTPIAAWRWRRRVREAVGESAASPLPAILVAGAFTTVGAAAQMTALLLTLAAYVIAVKRTSTLFSVLLGRSLFAEERTGERLLGAVVMLAGFALVTLA